MRAVLLSAGYALLCISLAACNPSAQTPNSDSASAPVKLTAQARAIELVAQMTLEEKAAQMYDKSPAIDRLGVPEYNWWNESLHGVARAGKATVFPQAIGLAATFDEDLMLRVGTAISDEGRAKHHDYLSNDVRAMYTGLTYWSPNINIFRDPRWGRGQETYGEDPYLTGRMAVNFVRGLQGDNPDFLKSVATVKHYAVHSGPEETRHIDNYVVNDRDLNETYLPAFKMAVKEADVQSVMCAYNAFRGDPACGSSLLLQDYLRDDFGFDGYVVSDCGAIGDFYYKTAHAFVETKAEAAAAAVKAGTDLNCGDDKGNKYAALPEAVAQGLISEAEIDRALIRLMTARYKLGMFDAPKDVPYAALKMDVVGSEKHLALTQEAAEKSYVLLKNDGLLPLKGSAKVALIGPNADSKKILIGNYWGVPVKPVTLLAALRERLGDDNVAYAPGSSLVADFYNHDTVVPASAFPGGLTVTYFDNADHMGDVVKTKKAINIDDYVLTSPLTGKIDEIYSIMWTGTIRAAETGVYRFGGKEFVGHVVPQIKGQDVPENGIRLLAGQTYPFSAKASVKPEWWANAIKPTLQLTWVNTSRDLKIEALRAAQDAEVIIFAGGLTAGLEGEEMKVSFDGFNKGDRTKIDVPASQAEMLKALHETGKPVIHVNYSGSAMAMNWSDANASAVIQGFYPGEAAGPALANILYGDSNPSGRLPITFYRGVSDLPEFKNYHMAGRTYKYYGGTPLYPFGHGLSYSEFEYSDVRISASVGGGYVVSGQITNRSRIDGEEVIQIYATWPEAPKEVPQLKLAAFKRLNVKAGQSVRFNVPISALALSVADDDGKMYQPEGGVKLSIGSGQPGFTRNIKTVDLR